MSSQPPPIQSRAVRFWGVGAAVVLALAVFLFLLSRQEPEGGSPLAPSSNFSPVPQPTPDAGVAVRAPSVPVSSDASSSDLNKEEDVVERKKIDAIRQQTENAFWEGRFHEAVVLGLLCVHWSAKNAECRKLIGDAHAALNHKEQAAEAYRAFLSMASHDDEHSAEIQQVRERLEASWEREKTSGDMEEPILRPSIVRPAPLAKEQAKSAYAEGLKLMKIRLLDDAAERAIDCIALEPNNVDCNLLAAAASSGPGGGWESERYYSRFLQLSPDVRKHSRTQRALKKYYWSQMLK